jgi:hypothetical protein
MLSAAAAVLVLVLGAVGASPSPAATSHTYLCQITGSGGSSTSASECDTNPNLAENPAVPGGPLSQLNAMTADSGRLFIAENTAVEYRTDRFDAATGAFGAQFPQAALPVADQGIAVGHPGGQEQLYLGVTNTVENRSNLAVFDFAGNLLATWNGADTTAGHFDLGAFRVAADNSSSAAAGDVYVAQGLRGVIDVFKPKPGGGEEYLTQLTGTCPSPGVCAPGEVIHFAVPFGLAVDQSNGDLVVADDKGVDIFQPTAPGEYAFLRQLTGTPAGPFSGKEHVSLEVAAGAGEVYVATRYTQAVYQFDSAGKYLGQLTRTPARPFGVIASLAVDPATHHLYVGDERGGPAEAGAVDVFGPDLILPDVETEAPTEARPFEATLRGALDPLGEGAAGCRFAWGTSAALGETLPCEPATVPNGSSPVAVHAKLPTQPDTTYFYRLWAENHNGLYEGESFQTQHFTTPGPGIHSTSASDVSVDSATLEATIDPHGAPTAYRFEYDTSPYSPGEPPHGASVPVPDQDIGSGEGDVEVTPQHLHGLAPGVVYHYRVVAVSELGEFPGPDHAFTTQTAAPFALPDDRHWELVSPPDKHGALLSVGRGFGGVAAATGDAVAYLANAPTEAAAPSFPSGSAQLLSIRGTGGTSSWSTHDLNPPYAEGSGVTSERDTEFKLFSSDLSLAAVDSDGGFNPAISPEATEKTTYLRTNFPSGDPAHPCAGFCFQPLLTGAEGIADVPPGTHFSTAGKCPPGTAPVSCFRQFRGATPDLAHIVLSSEVALTTTPLPAKEGVLATWGLYEWSAAAPPAERLRLISILPGGERPEPEPNLGVTGTSNASIAAETRGSAISADGSRVFFAGAYSSLYLRYNATRAQSALDGSGQCAEPGMACTIRLDALQGGSGGGEAHPEFQLASPDGSLVYFTDEQRLTPDSAASHLTPDLYRCRIVESEGRLRCELTDLTPAGSGGEAARVQGGVIGGSLDGSSLYFVANGVLTGAEANERGETARPGACAQFVSLPAATCNLYLYREGVLRFVAVVSDVDKTSWGPVNAEDHGGSVTAMNSRVSPDGRWLAFTSARPLTGYDNRDVKTGVRDLEDYLYDATSGRLHCVSCNPTGARPHGWEYGTSVQVIYEASELGLAESAVPGETVAGLIPRWPGPNYRSRLLFDSGRLFFESFDALSPHDTNGAWDVYQYEPPGVGGCTESGPTFSSQNGGCLDLISSGASPQNSFLLDASESGDDVFFFTDSRLTPSDIDTTRDLYDARVGGGEAESVKPVECQGDACQSPVGAPEDLTPGSLSFQGPGNLLSSVLAPVQPKARPVRCGKGSVKKHNKCVKTKRKKRAKRAQRAKKAKRANADRRTR